MLKAADIFLPLNVSSFLKTIKSTIQVSIGSVVKGILLSSMTFLLIGRWNLHALQPVHTNFTSPATLASIHL
jgi:hypothetical protein